LLEQGELAFLAKYCICRYFEDPTFKNCLANYSASKVYILNSQDY